MQPERFDFRGDVRVQPPAQPDELALRALGGGGFDPARDIRFTRTTVNGIAPSYEGIMGIDATWKKGYPEPLEMDPAIVQKVDKRWNQYWA